MRKRNVTIDIDRLVSAIQMVEIKKEAHHHNSEKLTAMVKKTLLEAVNATNKDRK